jgi:hypothetical protein
MVERAVTAEPQGPLLAEIISRMERVRHRVHDIRAELCAFMDAMRGTTPVDTLSGKQLPPTEGAIGVLQSEATLLEDAVAELEEQLRRTRNIA